MPYWDSSKKKWRGTVLREGNRRQELFDLKSDAKEWEANQKALPLEKFLERTPTEFSLAEWSTKYLDHVKAAYEDKTYLEKRLAFEQFFLSFKPTLHPGDLDPGDLLEHFEKQAKARSGNAANKDRKNLIAGWNWAVKYMAGWPEIANPFTKTDKQKGEEWPRYIPPVEDFWKVFDVAKGQDKVMLLTYLHTAARKSELFALKRADLDMNRHRIRLWTKKREGGLEADWIPMTDELHASLTEWLKVHPFPNQENVFACDDDEYNFSRDFYGQPYSSRVHWMKKLCGRAEVTPFGLHAIRHLSASILDDCGYPITVIQALLRHRSATTTSRYLHKLRGLRVVLDEAFKRPERKEVAKKIAEAVSGRNWSQNGNDRPLVRARDRSFLKVVK